MSSRTGSVRKDQDKAKLRPDSCDEILSGSDSDEKGSSICSETNSENSNDAQTSSNLAGARKKGLKSKKKQCPRGPVSGNAYPKLNYKFSNYWKENHGQALFGVSVNQHLQQEFPVVFATVGTNRITVYEGHKNGHCELVQCYSDPDKDESFYTCAWSYDSITGKPILAAAGFRGIIRILSCSTLICIAVLVGHGQCINELKFHPKYPNLLLSVSKDHNLRLWNIKSQHCIAIFGGVEGHRDEVLSADFDLNGDSIISCGMDHSLKIWKFNTEKIQKAIQLSNTFHEAQSKEVFPTEVCHFPDFTTRDIHTNYVDCCKWFGKCIISKSCENIIICWKPGDLTFGELNPNELKSSSGSEVSGKASVLYKFEFKDCDIWFIRFSMDAHCSVLAQGNKPGKTYVWDLDVEDPTQTRHTILSHPKCTSTVRQTGFSRDGSILITVCDDGTVWRWDKQIKPPKTS